MERTFDSVWIGIWLVCSVALGLLLASLALLVFPTDTPIFAMVIGCVFVLWHLEFGMLRRQ